MWIYIIRHVAVDQLLDEADSLFECVLGSMMGDGERVAGSE